MSDMTIPATPDAPARPSERLASLDILRGFAVMAIFLVNIKGMMMPFGYYMNGSLWVTELDQHIAVIQKFLVDDRWRTIFTMLFGAGLVLVSEKSVSHGAASGAGRLLRRNTWLLIFGAIHLLLIWQGDILFLYALAGFLAIWFRNMSVGKLTFWAITLLIISTAWAGGFGMFPAFDEELAAKLGGEFWGTDPAMLQDQIDVALGPITGQITARASEAVGFVLFYMILGGFLLVTVALMLVGMVLYKTGFLVGRRSVGTYLVVAIIMLAGASALEWFQYTKISASGYDFAKVSLLMPISMVDGYLGAIGFASLILAAVGAGMRFGPVAAVGRMAFTNYIICSLIGTTLAGGHAFGYFGSVSLAHMMVVCVVTFIAMLIWSPLWLSVFRFGPLEWLWRSLTYGRAQPLRR